MAIDTAAKRGSVLNFCNPFDHIMPIPDGSINAADRQNLIGMYSGILAAGGGSPSIGGRKTAWLTMSRFGLFKLKV